MNQLQEEIELKRKAQYTFYCPNCEKKVGALARNTKELSE